MEFKINNAVYEAEFTLESSESGSGKIEFSKSAIRGMDLEENFLEPFTNGNVYINNPMDFIEDGALIRGDGLDVFKVSFYPKDSGNGVGGFSGDAQGKKLEYKFVITGEVNSASQTDRLNNFKVYSLMDINYHKLNAKIPYGTRFRGKVGDIIKNILLQQCGDVTSDCLSWETGDMVIDVLPEHILPPSTFRYSDLLKYLLKINYKQVGKTYVKLFLNYCRTCKKFQYLALSDFFKFATDDPQEVFMANDLVDKIGEVNINNPAQSLGQTPVNVYNSSLPNSDFSTPMLVYTNAFLTNMLVSDYDPTLGEHKMKLLRIKEIKKEWKKLFVDIAKYAGGKAKPWLVLNSVKNSQVFRNIGFPFPGDKASKIAEAELTTNMTFFNLQLNFSTLGNVLREPGNAIDVAASRPHKEEGDNSLGGQVEHRSDSKLLGTWFITKVRHEFTTAKVDGYTNILQCIKPHIGPGGKEPEDCIDFDIKVGTKQGPPRP